MLQFAEHFAEHFIYKLYTNVSKMHSLEAMAGVPIIGEDAAASMRRPNIEIMAVQGQIEGKMPP